MLIRIVKMEFASENTEAFKELFTKAKSTIEASPGCRGVDLLRDLQNKNLFFTYSHWDNEEALENYRKSDFFRETWSQTKILFSNKPMAWSVGKVS